MATLQELVDRATDIAAGSIDGPLQDSEMMAQSLLPEVLQQVTAESALSPRLRTILRRTLTVAIAAGVGNLPDEALTAYAIAADVVDESGDYASWVRYDVFVQSPDPRLAHFALKEGTEIHYLPVGGSPYTGDIFVTLPCAPEIPALATDQVDMPEEILSTVVRTLADKMVLAYKLVK